MNFKSLLILFILYSIQSQAINFTSSNLPIVIITTDFDLSTGKLYEIVEEPKVPATLKIIYHEDGSRNYLADQNNPLYLNYNGKIGIEIRGSSSQLLPKKAYGLTTLKEDLENNNVSILGMPKENDWILNGLAFDHALIRDFLSYELYRDMGNYTSMGKYCELFINDDYKGLYIFMEKLKVDDNRINILKLSEEDNCYPEITGGYLTKSDKTTGGDVVAWSKWGVDFIHENPKAKNITIQQNNYIYSVFSDLATTAAKHNASKISGYPSIIDVPSFIDFMIISELASNVDAYQISTYYHKDRNGKLRAGPIWDFNLTYGLDIYGNRSKTDVWQFNDGDIEGPRFWKDLFNTSSFKCQLAKRWFELTTYNQPLNFTTISNKIDRIISIITEASDREQARWGNTGNHSTYIKHFKEWINQRMTWLNEQLTTDVHCSDIVIPPLVISKVNYHPVSTYQYDGDSLEFIEITNNGSQLVDLTGYYFRELGFSYQFPANSTIDANARIVIASNANVFKNTYGMESFGEFTRNLSNSSQKIVLADAFGNVIDSLTYKDSSPWPKEADGKGYYLELKNLNFDNSIGSNWNVAQPNFAHTINFSNNITLYPNPADRYIQVKGEPESFSSYKITDFTGITFQSGSSSDIHSMIDIQNLHRGVYYIILYYKSYGHIAKKFIKQ